jgi:uncharacterized membrane protein YadS
VPKGTSICGASNVLAIAVFLAVLDRFTWNEAQRRTLLRTP